MTAKGIPALYTLDSLCATQMMVRAQRGTGVMVLSGTFICQPAVQNHLQMLQCEEEGVAAWAHQKKFNPLQALSLVCALCIFAISYALTYYLDFQLS